MDNHSGNESPPPPPPPQARSTILGSFLRGRPRNSSQSHIIIATADALREREMSPSPPQPGPPSPNTLGHRRRTGMPSPVQASQSGSNNGLGLSQMLRRRRSGGQIAQQNQNQNPANLNATTPPVPVPVSATSARSSQAHRIRLVPHLESRRSLKFDAISRDLREGDAPLRIGRFTDRSGLGLGAVNALGTNKLAFKSKVVSRAHAEIWVAMDGRFYIKDTKSSSGTFLNHSRLSVANTESRPYPLKDGDVLQLGVDYQGGTEDIYKSVKIRVEIGREWQMQANAFNTAALKNLRALAVPVSTSKNVRSAIPDCCICLFGVTIQQALFIAPCSHTFHYKCIRPLLESHHPAFSCPLCRTFADLEQDVEVDCEPLVDDEEDSAVEEVAAVIAAEEQEQQGPSEAREQPGHETEVETDAPARPVVEQMEEEDMDVLEAPEEEPEPEHLPGAFDPPMSPGEVYADGALSDGSGSGEMGDGTIGSKRKR